MIGITAAYQYMLVEAVAKMANLGGRVPFTLAPILSCLADELTESALQHLTSAGSTLKIAPVYSVQELTQKVASSVNSWQRDGVKVLVLTTLPGGPANAKVLSHREGALHASSTRHFWFSQGLTGRLMSVLGKGNVVDLHVAPYGLNADARSEMARLVGTILPSQPNQDVLPDTERCVMFSNVKVTSPPVLQFRETPAAGPIDEWVCEAVMKSESKSGPISVFSKLPALMCSRVFEDRPLTADEEVLLDTMTMKHHSTGEVRAVSRHFHHRWLGIDNTPLSGALQEVHPCFPWVLEATGEQSDCRSSGSACGCKRFCLSCEKIFEGTSSLPPLGTTIAGVLAVLEVALKEWSQSTCTSWCERALDDAPHNCDASCPKNPQKGF